MARAANRSQPQRRRGARHPGGRRHRSAAARADVRRAPGLGQSPGKHSSGLGPRVEPASPQL